MKDIIVSNIHYEINSKKILSNINFTVNEGESFALLGENGSGKSTLINIILDDLKPNKGYIQLFEKEKSCFDHVGVLYDHLPLFPLLTVAESIHYFASIHELSYKEIEKQYFDIFDIQKLKKTLVSALSQGEKKKIGILLALIHHPKLLILDEPFAHLDPTNIDRIWNTIQKEKPSIFFSTHDWQEAEKQASKIAFIYHGEITQAPASPTNWLNTLPAKKKITLNKSDQLIKKIVDWQYYIHDEEVHIFFDEQSTLLDTIGKSTSNFSVQNVHLKDAYLFHIKNSAR